MRMRILITGFEPQFGIKKTPSGEIAKLWASGMLSVPGVEVRAVVLPQIFGVAGKDTCSEVAAFKPNAVIMYGATQHNTPIRLEKFAVNVRNSPMGDNTMVPVRDGVSLLGGPPGHEASWPCADISDAMAELEHETIVSYTAGTHVCNDQFYLVMDWLSKNDVGHRVAAGFVHVSFPNEFGVVEDRSWKTPEFPRLVDASICLVKVVTEWYGRQRPL